MDFLIGFKSTLCIDMEYMLFHIAYILGQHFPHLGDPTKLVYTHKNMF